MGSILKDDTQGVCVCVCVCVCMRESPTQIHHFHSLFLLFFSALSFALGALLVCVSIYLYGLPRQDTTSIQQEATSKERIIGV
jgi:hypothetical protein